MLRSGQNPLLLKTIYYYCYNYYIYIYVQQNNTDPSVRAVKAKICVRSFAGIAGSNPVGGMHVCLLWVLCVIM
jgi:hypothetical protein